MSQAPRMLYAGIAREIEYRLTMLLEGLAAEHLGEQISRIGLTRDVAHNDATSAAQLAHLVKLTINVPRVLRGREAVAQVVGPLVVRLDFHRLSDLVADELEQAVASKLKVLYGNTHLTPYSDSLHNRASLRYM